MSERLYFDCFASFGPRTKMHPEERWTLTHLLDDLDLAGIAGALVTYSQSTLYDPHLGNLALCEQLAGHRDRLFPCWVVLPPSSEDFPTVPELLRLVQQHEVRAVRIEPRTFGLPWRESAWAELTEMLAAERLLVTTGMDGWPPDYDLVERFLKLFRASPVLLLNTHWCNWRRVVDLMAAYPNLHLEFSTFQANRAIEYFAERFGAERCLFGTGLPLKAPGAARGFLDWTLLPEDAATKVAGGNLRRLLGGVGPTQVPGPGPWSDPLTQAARLGQPLPCEIWDDHCHILHDHGVSAGGSLVMYRGGAEGMIELTRRIGVNKTAVMSWAGPLSGDPDTGNEIVAAAVRQFPDEFLGLVTIMPELQSAAEIAATIQKYHVEQHFPGLKPFPRETLDYDDPLFDPWFRFADEHQLYMVYDPCKTLAAGTPVIEHLTRQYPRVTLHLDHCGQSWPYARWAVEMVRRFPQVYAQLNYTAVTNGVIEYIVEHAGADRVLFGTDAPMRDPRPQAGWLVFTRMQEVAKRQVFGANFRRLAEAAVAGLAGRPGNGRSA